MLENSSLRETGSLRERINALHRLELHLEHGTGPAQTALYSHAFSLRAKLEAINRELYESVRSDIQSGTGDGLLSWISSADNVDHEGYDYLDDFLAGVLQISEPRGAALAMDAEMVFYQPTPTRHIARLIERAAITSSDVFIDLGSGLGQVPIVVAACTGARCIGIELQPAYVTCARECAQALQLDRVVFAEQDVRNADLSAGTVFYLYTPFTGSVMQSVLERLKGEAESRAIRICTYGPCTEQVASETWLTSKGELRADSVALFQAGANNVR